MRYQKNQEKRVLRSKCSRMLNAAKKIGEKGSEWLLGFAARG